MLLNLLTSTESSAAGNQGNGWGTLLMMGIFLLIIIAFSVYNNRAQKKRQAQMQKELDSIQCGTEVKTIGGIYGVVVEVGEDTFVVETGLNDEKKSYIKFDKKAVYPLETYKEEKSAKAEKVEEVAEEPAEEVVEEATEEKADNE